MSAGKHLGFPEPGLHFLSCITLPDSQTGVPVNYVNKSQKKLCEL